MASPCQVTEEHVNINRDKLDPKGDAVQTEDVLEPEEEPEWKLTFGKLMAMASFQLGYLSDVFVLSMASAILTTINKEIGPSPSYTWAVTAQVIGAAVLSPMTGRLSDIFGRRSFLIAGNVVAMIGTAVAATSTNINTLIGASTLIGMGSAMHQLAWSCLGEMVPKRHRGTALGIFQSTLAPSSAFGPLIADAFTLNTTWRAIYWLPFAMDSAALVLVFFFYHPINQYIRQEGETVLQQIYCLDWIGFFLFGAGLVLFLLGISFGGHQFEWTSAGTIAPIIIGLFLLVALGFYEAKAKLKYPMFPPIIFANIRGFTVILAGIFVMGMLYYSSGVLWPQQIQSLYTQDLISVGWYASALGLTAVFFGPLGGWMMIKLGHARWLYTGWLAALTVFTGLEALVTPTSNIVSTIFTGLIGMCITCATVVSTAMIQLGVSHEFIGVATGLAITSRSVGGSIGTTIYTAVLQDRLEYYVKQFVSVPLAMAGVATSTIEAVTIALLSGDTTNSVIAQLQPSQLSIIGPGLKQAFAHSFRVVYLVAIAFGVIGTIFVAFSANVDHLMTKEVDVMMEEGPHVRRRKHEPPGNQDIEKTVAAG